MTIQFQSNCILLISVALLYASSLLGIQTQDSLLNVLSQDPTITSLQKVDIYIELSGIYTEQSIQDSSLKYAQRAIKIAQSNDLKIEEARSYYSLGYAHDIFGNLNNAIENYEISRQIYEQLGNKEEVATCMNSKGVAAYLKGDYELALDHYLACLKYVELHNIEGVMANTLNNLGVMYRVTNKGEDAIEVYFKTLRLSKRTQNQNMIGTSYHNLGVAYNFEGQLDKSLIYFDSATTHYLKVGDFFELGRIKTAIGEALYFNDKPYSEARKFLIEGEMNFLKSNIDQEVLFKTYLLLAQVERDDGKYNEAKIYFDKAYSFIRTTERAELRLDYYNEIQEYYSIVGNDKKANQYLTKYISLYKELQSNEKVKAIEELQTQYETKEKEQQILVLKTRDELQSNKLETRRSALLALGGGSLLLLVFSLMISRLYRKVRLQNGLIEKSLSEKDTLLREIHHRVKNNLQVISALLTLQSKHVKDDIAFEALQEGQGRVQSMALIHQDLYQHENLNGVNTKDYFEKLMENLIDTYKTDDRNIELHSDIESMILDVDTMIPLGLVVNELTSNALKHAFSGKKTGNITITLFEINDQLHLSVKDDGKGTEVFHLENKSFGFSLIKSFARRLDAELNIENKNGLNVALLINNYKKSA